jgi:holo-[acyl-carrier protein] synthase
VTAHPVADRASEAARDLTARLAAKSSAAGAVSVPEGGTATTGIVGVGIDAVDLDRFRTVLGRRSRLAWRLFTAGELDYAALAPDPAPRLATRFAAKEAVMKALGVGLWSFRLTDVEVVRDGLDAPTLALHDGAADLAAVRGVGRWHLSLTHTDTVALAVVVAERDGVPAAGDRGA